MFKKLDKTLFLIKSIAASCKNESTIYMSSSFQTQSVPLLYLVGKNFPNIKIVFIDTGFLFKETYAFKAELKELFKLNIVTIHSKKSYSEQQTASGLFLYSEDTERCCFINKVQPLNDLIKSGDYWISGVRKDQTSIRAKMKPIETDHQGVVRIHPMLEWNSKDIYDFIREHKLPKHPLEKDGFISIGCVPCTHKYDIEGARGGRWVGKDKTECGLHLTK